MLHNFMMAAFEAGVSMSRYRTEPAEIARCFIEAVEKYEYDGIVVDVDTATLAGACGVPVVFPEDEPAIYRGQRLRSLDEVRDLEPADVGRYPGVQVWLEAVRLLKRHFGDEIYLRGNCDQAPFALACAMRGSADWMMDIMDPANEEDVRRLLEFCDGCDHSVHPPDGGYRRSHGLQRGQFRRAQRDLAAALPHIRVAV